MSDTLCRITVKDATITEIEYSQNALAQLGESIGKSIAKWLIKADLPTKRGELQEMVYCEMGFQPIEVVDLLYPSLGKAERRAKAQAISKRLKKNTTRLTFT